MSSPKLPAQEAGGVPIHLNGHNITPESQMPGGDLFSESASKTNYVLIQFTEYPTQDQEKTLRELDVQYGRFIPPCTWLVKYEPVDLGPIRDLPFVLYANPYHDSLSLNPFWRDKLTNERGTQGLVGETGMSSSAPAQLYRVSIVLHPGSRMPEDMVKLLASEYGIARDRLVAELTFVRASLSASEILRISKLDEVSGIHQASPIVLHNHLVRENIRVVEAEAVCNRNLKTNSLKLDGDGEVVAIADSGLDDGTKDNKPGDKTTDIHPFFRHGRVLHLDPRSDDKGITFEGLPTTRKDTVNDWTGHGTHVAATVLGSYDGLSKATQLEVRAKTSRLDGVAPKASLIMQAVFGCPQFDNTGENNLVLKLKKEDLQFAKLYLDPYYGYPDTWATRVNTWDPLAPASGSARAQSRVARIHNNSYGPVPAPSACGYTESSNLLDAIVYSVPDYFMVFAGGNYGDDQGVLANFPKGQVTGGAAAKNVISVGACFNNQYIDPNLYLSFKPKGKGFTSSWIPKSSSRGPTASNDPDNSVHRDIIKPDIVAPGVALYSAKSRGVVRGLFSDANGIVPEASRNNLCQFMSGTSMAAPVVAGAAALLRQALRRRRNPMTQPSAALIKALMVNGAVDLSDTAAGPNQIWAPYVDPNFKTNIEPAPSDAQGWGRLDVEDSVDTATDTTLCAVVDIPAKWTPGPGQSALLDPRLDPGLIALNEHKYPATIRPPPDLAKKPDSVGNIKVTLAWTDFYGEGLQNQLSLHLVFDEKRKAHNIEVDVTKNGPDKTLARMAGNNVQKLVVRDIVIPAGDQVSLTVFVKVQHAVADPALGGNKPPLGYALCWKVWYSKKRNP